MILWVNRLYPNRKRTRAVSPSVSGASGDTNIYYTLPVTQTNTNLTNERNTSTHIVEHSAQNVTNAAKSQTSRVSNAYSETRDEHNVTYQTTVQVDMVNHNQIHGEQDMRKIAEYLRDALQETLLSSAEGVM